MNGKRTSEHGRGFTLIELLVVISIVVLLMALLFPALQRAKKQAHAVACQVQLHEAGLIFSLYVSENDGRFLRYKEGGTSAWFTLTNPPFREHAELSLCPSATKPLPEENVWWGDTFHAYSWSWAGVSDTYGSYGTNYHVYDRSPRGRAIEPTQWTSGNVRGAGRIPLLCDSATLSVAPRHTDPPGEFEGYIKNYPFSEMCLNRHHHGINVLFLDWSVRKVGLKELWTLKWHRQFNTSGPWTKAGGALPEDWPEWMRQFKDY
jgi:prepilin-type N-terminal cleavage/methylation domain-containing protein